MRYLVIGTVGELVIFNEHIIGKWSVGEIGKAMTLGDNVELADVMTRSKQSKSKVTILRAQAESLFTRLSISLSLNVTVYPHSSTAVTHCLLVATHFADQWRTVAYHLDWYTSAVSQTERCRDNTAVGRGSLFYDSFWSQLHGWLTSEHVRPCCIGVPLLLYFQLRQLRQVRCLLTSNAIKSLVHAFTSSRLEYCNSLLTGIGDGVLRKLQSVQNAAARLITNTRKFDHITPVLRDLH